MSDVRTTAAAGTGLVVAPVERPITLEPGSWQWRLVKKAESLHSVGKPVILVLRLGDQPPNWLKCVPDGR